MAQNFNNTVLPEVMIYHLMQQIQRHEERAQVASTTISSLIHQLKDQAIENEELYQRNWELEFQLNEMERTATRIQEEMAEQQHELHRALRRMDQNYNGIQRLIQDNAEMSCDAIILYHRYLRECRRNDREPNLNGPRGRISLDDLRPVAVEHHCWDTDDEGLTDTE